ncbi:hypothetical protein M083_2555 [Bacteroides fragilis str. 3986 T(B)9]|uniref:Uncharacterized protein n=5 Tax=Bacteroides fragilis TaxID=817 RepID=A0A015X1Q8_BACFG|nr:hypothetical protein M101_2620 [Bacteroides fragilis str. 1007-1-F \
MNTRTMGYIHDHIKKIFISNGSSSIINHSNPFFIQKTFDP